MGQISLQRTEMDPVLERKKERARAASVAMHEAGHAIVGLELGYDLDAVELHRSLDTPLPRIGGICTWNDLTTKIQTRDWPNQMANATLYLAGQVAEQRGGFGRWGDEIKWRSNWDDVFKAQLAGLTMAARDFPDLVISDYDGYVDFMAYFHDERAMKLLFAFRDRFLLFAEIHARALVLRHFDRILHLANILERRWPEAPDGYENRKTITINRHELSTLL